MDVPHGRRPLQRRLMQCEWLLRISTTVVYGILRDGMLMETLNMMRAVVLDKIHQVLDGTVAYVDRCGALVAGLVELDERHVRDVLGNVVLDDVHLGNDDLLGAVRGAVHAGQGLVHGSQGAAVRAVLPEVVQQDILARVHDHIVVVVGHHRGDGAVVRRRDRLGLDAGLQPAGHKVLDERADGGGIHAPAVGELLLGGALVDAKGREIGVVVDGQVQVAREAGKVGDLGRRELERAGVLFGERPQLGGEPLAVGVGLGKDETGRTTGPFDVLAPGIRAHLPNERLVAVLGKRLDGVDLPRLVKDRLAVVLGAVQHDRRKGHPGGLRGGQVRGDAEGEILMQLFCGGEEGGVGCGIGAVNVTDDHDLAALLEEETVMGLLVAQDGDGGEDLFRHELHDAARLISKLSFHIQVVGPHRFF